MYDIKSVASYSYLTRDYDPGCFVNVNRLLPDFCSCAGVGAAGYINPPSGSVITNFEGTVNAVTITCNIINSMGVQITTQWTLESYGNSPPGVLVPIGDPPTRLFEIDGDLIPGFSGTYENRLTVLNLTSALDEVIVHCGSGADPRQGSITLRIYRKSWTAFSKGCLVTNLFYRTSDLTK